MGSGKEIVDLSDSIVSERENFYLSGPLHLTTVDWSNPDHRRSISACLVQSVYILERDRQANRAGPHALAPPWFETFGFQLYRQLIDNTDSSIFGAIFRLPDHHPPAPRHVIAFRGTITKGNAFTRDLELDIHVVRNGLHQTSRFETAIQAVRHVIATFGSSSGVWLAGHSLGAAMALLAGKNTAKTGTFLDSFLFNPPFFSAPIETIKDKKVKHGIRFAGSVITAGLAFAMKNNIINTNHNNNGNNRNNNSFEALVGWFPGLFVNSSDHICSEYVGYFEHRERMEEIGVGNIERLATQHSIGGLLLSAVGKRPVEEPLHLLPSAILSVNRNPARDFKDAHGIHQWWREGLCLETKRYSFR
ncbi:alpha/beta-Hydrolases superfamily protein [Striga asiatica]|uniref:Alpha/beta-Hydrolases superfamily protein n=1 Tax=Striga asiatica TaxID=4170 RepID=A0A5A7P1Y4_STRAF|nr:alpha/beta-Hydrolases superfamily protein [Striga asiatica]